MSVITFSAAELSQIASSIYKKYSEFIDTYQERQTAIQESKTEIERQLPNPRSELDIRLDAYRWIWEDIALSNKMEALKRYSNYGQSEAIEYDKIDVLSSQPELSVKDLYHRLRSIRYNADHFLNTANKAKLDGWIDMVSDDFIRHVKDDQQ